jgi:hypothetical protein
MKEKNDSPASIAKRDIEWVGLGNLAGLSDQAIRVERHWILIDLWVVHEVPIIRAHTR